MTSKKELLDLLRAAAIDCLQAERALSNSEKKRVLANLKKVTKNLKTVSDSL